MLQRSLECVKHGAHLFAATMAACATSAVSSSASRSATDAAVESCSAPLGSALPAASPSSTGGTAATPCVPATLPAIACIQGSEQCAAPRWTNCRPSVTVSTRQKSRPMSMQLVCPGSPARQLTPRWKPSYLQALGKRHGDVVDRSSEGGQHHADVPHPRIAQPNAQHDAVRQRRVHLCTQPMSSVSLGRDF